MILLLLPSLLVAKLSPRKNVGAARCARYLMSRTLLFARRAALGKGNRSISKDDKVRQIQWWISQGGMMMRHTVLMKLTMVMMMKTEKMSMRKSRILTTRRS